MTREYKKHSREYLNGLIPAELHGYFKNIIIREIPTTYFFQSLEQYRLYIDVTITSMHEHNRWKAFRGVIEKHINAMLEHCVELDEDWDEVILSVGYAGMPYRWLQYSLSSPAGKVAGIYTKFKVFSPELLKAVINKRKAAKAVLSMMTTDLEGVTK